MKRNVYIRKIMEGYYKGYQGYKQKLITNKESSLNNSNRESPIKSKK